MADTQTTRRCHWVPQSYLKTFAIDLEKPSHVWQISNSQEQPIEPKKIQKVAVRNRLYVPKDAEGKFDDALEKDLSELEQGFGELGWQELCNRTVDLSWDSMRKMVGLLAAQMLVRNPNQFEVIKNQVRQMNDLRKSHPEPPDSISIGEQEFQIDKDSWHETVDPTDDNLKRIWIDNIRDASSIARMMMDMRWTMIVSQNPCFITSDNPVCIMHPSFKFMGLKNAETSVLFPISPTHLLLMDNRHTEPSNRYCDLMGSAGGYNGLMLNNAIQFGFSHRDPGVVFEEIISDMEKYPPS